MTFDDVEWGFDTLLDFDLPEWDFVDEWGFDVEWGFDLPEWDFDLPAWDFDVVADNWLETQSSVHMGATL